MSDNGETRATGSASLVGPTRTSPRGSSWHVEVETECPHPKGQTTIFASRYALCKACGASLGAGGVWRRLVEH